MPTHPHFAPAVQTLRSSVYAGARPAAGLTPIPLHIGDTWMEPPAGCRMEDFRVADHPGMHRYTAVAGLPALRARIAELESARTGLETAPEQVLITAGATAGLAAAVGALVAPGEQVLLGAPHWPLIAGAVRAFNAEPVSVPLMTAVDSAEEAVACFERLRSKRTAAVYWNTPHNPTGRVMPREWLAALSDWAKSRDLWILSDEVYEDYVYAGEHVPTRPLAPELTIAAHSFSKAYGMTGNRCGYLVGPGRVIEAIERIITNLHYSACTASQLAALKALDGPGQDWATRACIRYSDLGRQASEALGLSAPEGSTFLFPEVSSALDERGLPGLLTDLTEQGVLVAPGPTFGPYPNHVRLCFTAAEPEQVRRGVEILAKRLGV
ncbi:pyridoxal phosphate-dependent aminotransferase [Wenzhouxiangella limi]|uniref:Pyridoxal phosphate-dependent aminotransferase n=1 Tax=Wenzhouxiangella limi TaxID=2707351 RepID=A0A845V0T3_9GAMM|nr:pyridoxal phosphate-dependent aminotransferase [Wenzhouxiangella limi]NDY96182.1 pyridoxal phosphate-dependent aminotransferase [Wenzhouxiangella limi]